MPLANTGCDSYASWHPAFKHLSPSYSVEQSIDTMLDLTPNNKWVQDNGNDVHLVITGGEPLLSKETFRTLDWIIENPNPELELAINTNLGVDQDIIDKFFEKCQQIKRDGKVKSLKIFTSCDTWGRQAEYIRAGLDYKKWYYNLWNLALRYPELDVTIMCTFNLLSIPQFRNFLKDILAIRRSPTPRYKTASLRGVAIDFPYLRHPRHLSALIAGPGMIDTLEKIVEWMDPNHCAMQTSLFRNRYHKHNQKKCRKNFSRTRSFLYLCRKKHSPVTN